MFNDRPRSSASSTPDTSVESSGLPKPEISIVVDGNQIFKPGMKSVFVDDDMNVAIGSGGVPGGNAVTGAYCSCNSVQVCTCNTVCTCESVCNCVGNCTCNPMCSCDGHCSCNKVCSCENVCTCNPQGGSYCSCVPVH